ncbi:tetratricopeptide repeat protein [uncultured Sphingomonas sp.]|uniref:tetratricopeptide repeat protein n=1 Tax=uncultured Sphingomonas sp. TaxID=158754 RepID=UPI0035C95690
MIKHLVSAAVALLPVALSAPIHAKDRTGYRAIATGDFARAERTLVAERRIFPNRPELMINLAAVYLRTGRAAEANALYSKVLTQPATLMELPSGRAVTSHQVASTALASIGSTVAVASR